MPVHGYDLLTSAQACNLPAMSQPDEPEQHPTGSVTVAPPQQEQEQQQSLDSVPKVRCPALQPMPACVRGQRRSLTAN